LTHLYPPKSNAWLRLCKQVSATVAEQQLEQEI